MAHVLLHVDHEGQILDDVPCSTCDMPLKGANAGGYCPNCGAVIALSLLGRAVTHLDGQGKIAEPVACATCGYPLIGVDPAGACPECHGPVGPALEMDLLRYANPRWLKGVSDGLMLYFISMILNLLLTIGNAVFGIIWKNDPGLRTIVGISVTVVMGIFSTIAIWWVTSPDPDTPLPLQKRAGANLARLLVIPQFALALPGIYFTNAASTPTGQMQAGLISLSIGLIGLAVSAGMLLHFGQLARRAVDERLERWARIILWLSVGGMLVGMIGGAVAMASLVASGMATPGGAPGATSPSGGAFIGMFAGGLTACSGALAGLVGLVWLIVFIFSLRTHFARAVMFSRPLAVIAR